MNTKLSAIVLSGLIALSLNGGNAEAVRLADTVKPAAPVAATVTETAKQSSTEVTIVSAAPVKANFTVSDFLKKMSGEWYDVRNYKTIVVTTEIPAINGCPILSFNATGTLDDKGTAVVELKEDNGSKTLKLEWEIDKKNRLNNSIKVDGKPTYRHAAGNAVSESVASYRLWMTEGEVRAKASSPGSYMKAEDVEAKTGIEREGWYFEDDIIFTYNPYSKILGNIILLNTCDVKLDKSQLNCKSSLEEFAKFYGWKKVPKAGDIMPLDNEMYISFKNYPNSIALTIYPD